MMRTMKTATAKAMLVHLREAGLLTAEEAATAIFELQKFDDEESAEVAS